MFFLGYPLFAISSMGWRLESLQVAGSQVEG
jgi:hypothetical protein